MLTSKQITGIWDASSGTRAAITKRRNYYDGKQNIPELLAPRLDGRAKSVVRTNWTRYTASMHSGFLTSIPPTYAVDGGGESPALTRLRDLYRASSLAASDRRLLSDAITYGYGVEVVGFDGLQHVVTRTRPWEWSFLRDEMGGINTAIRQVVVEPWTMYRGDVVEARRELYDVYDAETISTWERQQDGLVMIDRQDHAYGRPPVVVYTATEDGTSFLSDAFLVQSDIYDISRSSLQDDIKTNIDSFLVLTGVNFKQLLEKDLSGTTVLEKLKTLGVLPLQNGDQTAQYISRNVDIEKFKYDLRVTRASIHLMGCIPDLDETISGNEGTLSSISGIALKLMFQSMLQASSEFAAQFTTGLRQRVDLLNRIDSIRGLDQLQGYDVTLSRNLPYNEVEFIQYLPNLKGIISNKEALRQLPFVRDVERVMRELDEEAKASSTTSPAPRVAGFVERSAAPTT